MALPLREAREMFEREYLVAQINRFGGNISRTAEFVGMERSACTEIEVARSGRQFERTRASLALTGGGALQGAGESLSIRPLADGLLIASNAYLRPAGKNRRLIQRKVTKGTGKPMATERAQNLQDTFLNHVRKQKTPLTIFLVNGVKLQGVVTWFDNFCVLLAAMDIRSWSTSMRFRPSCRVNRSSSQTLPTRKVPLTNCVRPTRKS